ncbi:MAG: autotransporter-associated beta strand repeat-containing protein, partial [Verrucomicrobiaceae bacterium]|nr:autotransporter-associated beta strand repeat-containing protein [Verrucomicrobiaceae bacterium]
GITQVPLTTSASNSLVIAGLQNSGNGNSAGTPTANAPLTQSASGNWGSQWGSLAVGHIQVASPGTVTPIFTTSTGGSYSINAASIEVLAETQPLSTWTQTAGGAQSWNTAANWIANTVPTPLAGDTVDFSTVDIAANTTLTLGADRTGGLWKFGDTTGTETWTVNAGNTLTLAGTTPTIDVAQNTATLNCVVAGTAGLTKTGAGILALGAANTYTGGTTLTQGNLLFANNAALGAGTFTVGSGSGPYWNNTSGSPITTANNMVWAGNYFCGGTWVINGNVSITANSTQEIYGNVTVNGVVSGTVGINKQGTSGNLILNGLNTYTGQTVIRQGSITVNTLKNYGVASSLGMPTTTNIVIAPNNSSSLIYTGTGDSTNRPIQAGGTGSAGTTATVANNGSGPLIFTAAAFNAPVGITTGSAARVIALGGSFGTTATPNEVQGVIADNTLNGATAPANQISLSKTGTSTWKISGANTYSGTTSITGGTLILGANNVLPSSTNVTIGAATLDADTRSDSMGSLNVSAAATIRLGTGAALAFTDSSAVTWAGTLSITGTFVSGSSLRFGSTANALTATQLSKISSAGFTSFSLNSSGYLIGLSTSGFTYWSTVTYANGALPIDQRGPSDDFDKDGLNNLLEFAIAGNDPTVPGGATGSLSGQTVSFTKRPGISGLTYAIESSAELGASAVWSEVSGGSYINNASVISYVLPTGATKLFVRLRVTSP